MSTICELKKNVLIPYAEQSSAMLELSAGCSWAKCSFCPQSAGVPLQAASPQMLANRLLEMVMRGEKCSNIFLAGENALAFKAQYLMDVLDMARSYLPDIEGFSIYGRAADVRGKSDEQLVSLKKAGLKTIYIGIESGNPQILLNCSKGESPEQMKEQLDRLDSLGIGYGLSIILGLGGKELRDQHIDDTAAFLSTVNPRSIQAMTLVLVKGTALEKDAREGRFVPASAVEILEEEYLLLEKLHCSKPCQFISNHVYNSPPLSAVLPEGKAGLCDALAELLHSARKDPLGFRLGSW